MPGRWDRDAGRANTASPRVGPTPSPCRCGPDLAAAGASIATAAISRIARPSSSLAPGRVRRPWLRAVPNRRPDARGARVASARGAADSTELRPDAGPDLRRQVRARVARCGACSPTSASLNPAGVVQGGFLAAMLDSAMGASAVTTVRRSQSHRRQHRDEGLVPAPGAPGTRLDLHRHGSQGRAGDLLPRGDAHRRRGIVWSPRPVPPT